MPGPLTMQPSKRSAAIKPFIAMDILDAAKQMESSSPDGQTVLHLELGQPIARPPKPILDAAASALLHNDLGYTPSLGIPQLREAIAARYVRVHGASLHAQDVAVTTGASTAFLSLFSACFDAGDRVAVLVPGYPCYRHILASLSVHAVELRTRKQDGWHVSLEHLEAAHAAAPLAGVVLATPNNPTGTIIPAAELRRVEAFCTANSIRLIVDEIYLDICETLRPSATALLGPDVVVVSSVSKFWCMTGFRVGWAIVRDRALMHAVQRCTQSMTICAPTLSQYAALAAVGGDCDASLAEISAGYVVAARELVDGLCAVGFEASVPDGAFYVYSGCEAVCRRVGVADSVELCRVLLKECQVACTPGVDFDEREGHHFVRFSCACGTAVVRETAERIRSFISSLKTT